MPQTIYKLCIGLHASANSISWALKLMDQAIAWTGALGYGMQGGMFEHICTMSVVGGAPAAPTRNRGLRGRQGFCRSFDTAGCLGTWMPLPSRLPCYGPCMAPSMPLPRLQPTAVDPLLANLLADGPGPYLPAAETLADIVRPQCLAAGGMRLALHPCRPAFLRNSCFHRPAA